MADQGRFASQHVGELGERFVAQLLCNNGWVILHHRWHCRWGEIDIIAQAPEPVNQLIFVEVKVRGARNWDQAGVLSITPQKQQKLVLAAQTFLSEEPGFEEHDCRFDVALVLYEKKPRESDSHQSQGLGLTTLQASLDQDLAATPLPQVGRVDEELRLFLHHYIQGAFTAE